MPASKIGYDLEKDLGVVAWDDSLATRTRNTNLLSAAANAAWTGGTYTFTDFGTRSVLLPIFCSAKTFYFLPPILLNARIGVALIGYPGGGYIMLDGEFGGAGTLGGAKTRFVGINEGSDSYPVIRIRGNGSHIHNIDVYGRKLDSWLPTGTRAVSCIQVEGRSGPVAGNDCGRPSIINCGLYESQYAIQTKAGYYDSEGVFIDNEAHADLGFVKNLECFNCDSVFRSENQQAVGWHFNRLVYEESNSTSPGVLFDLVRGGYIRCNTAIINRGKTTLVKVQDYSPSTNDVEISGLFWDRASTADPTNYLTLFDYSGPSIPSPGYPWRVRISGGLADIDDTRYDPKKFIRVPDTTSFDSSNLFVDINHLPTDDFKTAGSGPYSTWRSVANTNLQYRFDENTGTTTKEKLDIGPTGTITGASWTTGHTKYGLSFANNSGNHVALADHTRLRSYVDATGSFWIYLPSYTNGCVLTKTTNTLAGIRLESSGSHFYFTEGGINRVDVGTYVTTGAWHHICWTITSGYAGTVYVDGVSRGTATFGANWLVDPSALRIGAPTNSFFTSGTSSATMTFDDLRFYDRVLSASEITELASL